MNLISTFLTDYWYLLALLIAATIGIGIIKKILALIKIGLILILIWIISSNCQATSLQDLPSAPNADFPKHTKVAVIGGLGNE